MFVAKECHDIDFSVEKYVTVFSEDNLLSGKVIKIKDGDCIVLVFE